MNGLSPKESKQNQNMKTKTKMIFLAALVAALIVLPRAHAVTGGDAPADATAVATNNKPADVMASLFGDPVIVKGNGFEIKQSQLDGVMDDIKARAAATGQTVPQDDLTKTVLDSLIGNQILFQKATDADKADGKKEADQYIAQIVKHYGSQELVEEQLKAAGKTFDGWRSEMTEQRIAAAVMIRELNATPTDAEVQKYYEDNPKASELPEEVHVRHILLLTIDSNSPGHAPLPDDQVRAKRKQIDDILTQLRGGADFATLAKEYSEDPGSKDNGGELPPFARASDDPSHAMVPEFESAAFSMTNNQISDVITTQYGYHIIKLLDKMPARKLALTDNLPASDTTLADQIKDFLTGQKLKEQAPAYIEKLSQSPGVEILDPALKALMSASTNAPAAQ
jgi:parvulin-like peptidyl-prolyl isomerase